MGGGCRDTTTTSNSLLTADGPVPAKGAYEHVARVIDRAHRLLPDPRLYGLYYVGDGHYEFDDEAFSERWCDPMTGEPLPGAPPMPSDDDINKRRRSLERAMAAVRPTALAEMGRLHAEVTAWGRASVEREPPQSRRDLNRDSNPIRQVLDFYRSRAAEFHAAAMTPPRG